MRLTDIGVFALLLCLVNLSPGAFAGTDNPGPETDLERAGLLSVTTYGATPDDETDDTRAIQQAIDDARQKRMVVFFPPGVYMLSDTVSAVQQNLWDEKSKKYRHQRNRPNFLLGSSKGRAILRLAANAKGFDNPKRPKPLVWIWAEPRLDRVTHRDRRPTDPKPEPDDEQTSISFDQVFRRIDIDLRASGNSGAVGIRHAGSQGSMMEDVTVWADGALAGIINTPGQGGGAYNITVLGGQVGIIGERRARFPVLAGIRLLDQKKANFVWQGQSNATIAGFHFRLAGPGSAVRMQRRKKVYNSALVLVDGVIESRGSVAVDDADGGNLYVRNVWHKGNSKIASEASAVPDSDGRWVHVRQYVRSDHGDTQLFLDGKRTSAMADMVAAGSDGPDIEQLLQVHRVADAPSIEDAAAVDARDFGAKPDDGKDDVAAIEKALQQSGRVFLAKGTYELSRTLVLPHDGYLFGVAKHLSILRPSDDWVADGGEPLITTEDRADATTGLSTIRLEIPNDKAHTAIAWRAGRQSTVRDIMVGPTRTKGGISRKQRTNKRADLFRIEKNGGGQWLGLAAEWSVIRFATGGADYRHLRIDGTKEPLRFYGLNVERSLTEPQSTISNSTDVSIFYMKSEPQKKRGNTVLEIKNARKIDVLGYSGISNSNGGQVFKLSNSDDVTLANLQPLRPSGAFDVVSDDQGGAQTRVSGSMPVSIYRRSPD